MEDLKQIQEFFSKPLNEVSGNIDIEDFAKVVKAVEQTGHPVTVLLSPMFGKNEIELVIGMDAPDPIGDSMFDVMNDLGYRRGDYSIVGDTSTLSRREYAQIRRVNGGHKDYRRYFEESVNENALGFNDSRLSSDQHRDLDYAVRDDSAYTFGNDPYADDQLRYKYAVKMGFLNEAEYTNYSNNELATYCKNNPTDRKAAKELHKRSQALKGLTRTDVNEGAVEIMDAFNDVMDLVKKYSRNLSDDDSYALALKLKAWFNKNILDETTDYMKRRRAMDDYAVSKKDKPAKPYNPNPSGKTDYQKRREKDLDEAKKDVKGDITDLLTGRYGWKFQLATGVGALIANLARHPEMIEKLLSMIGLNEIDEAKVEVDDKTEFKLDLKHLLDKHVIEQGYSLTNEVTRYSGFNRNPEDPDSEPFQPTGSVAEFKEDLRALFGKFKGDLKNPEFIEGVAQIMVNWKALLRSQLDENKKMAEYIAETIKLGQQLNEELCDKGKRYIKARQAAGEKSSAYLSGRAVRVCKGQIDWPKKGKKKK